MFSSAGGMIIIGLDAAIARFSDKGLELHLVKILRIKSFLFPYVREAKSR